jgi:hypothetical protein
VKARHEIINARILVSNVEYTAQCDSRTRAALYGMKCALAMCNFQLPIDQVSWEVFLNRMVANCDPLAYSAFGHGQPKVQAEKTANEWAVFRTMAKNVPDHLLRNAVMLGVRLACAWVLDLPPQPGAVDRVLDGTWQGAFNATNNQ